MELNSFFSKHWFDGNPAARTDKIRLGMRGCLAMKKDLVFFQRLSAVTLPRNSRFKNSNDLKNLRSW